MSTDEVERGGRGVSFSFGTRQRQRVYLSFEFLFASSASSAILSTFVRKGVSQRVRRLDIESTTACICSGSDRNNYLILNEEHATYT